MFSVLLRKVSKDIVFSSVKTCTEILSHQTIKLTSDEGQVERSFHITQSCT